MAHSPAAPAAVAQTRYEQRYGKPSSSRRPLWVVVIVCGILGVAALSWLAWDMLQPTATGEVARFEVVDDRQVDFILEVTRPIGEPGVCTIEALGDGFAQVGLLEKDLEPATSAVIEVPLTIATSERATVAVVRECRLN